MPAARRLSRILLGEGGRARPVRGSLTAGRCACPAGYSGLSGGYSRRARTSRGCAPQRASQGEGRATPPLMLSPPLLGAIVSGARQYVWWKGRAAPIPWTQPRGRCGLYKCRDPPHCSRRSLHKRSTKPTIRGTAELSFSLRPFFKKAGKFFGPPFLKKRWELFSKKPEGGNLFVCGD